MLNSIRGAACIVVFAISAVACGGNNARTPTSASPTTLPPVVVVTPPPVTPSTPAPPATPYSGRWSGTYIIDRCDGTGSVQDLLCGSRRGLYPPGSSLPIALDLTQSGSTVSGTISLGLITGVVTGSVMSSGLLTLSGIARSGTATATITYWDTRALGSTMDGFFHFNATYLDIPGVAAVSARLGSVRK